MFEDTGRSIKASLYDRVSNPLIGTFMISWGIINWRLLFVVFSGQTTPIEKLAFIDQQLIVDSSNQLCHWFLYPVLSTFSLLFILPFPSKWVYEFWRRQRKELIRIKQKIDDETPLTVEQSKQITSKYFELDSKYQVMLQAKNAEIERLNKLLGDYKTNEVQGYKTSNSPFNDPNQLISYENEFLTFKTKPLYASFQQSLRVLHEGAPVDSVSGFEGLANLGLIVKNSGRVFLTDKGKYFAQLHEREKR